MEKTMKALENLYSKLYDITDDYLGNEFYYDDRRGINISNHIDNTVSDFIDSLLENETFKNKLVKQVKKLAVEEIKKRKKAEKNSKRKNRELWKITKGNIPCICNCGFVRKETKDQVMNGYNTYACKECSEKAQKEGKSISNLFSEQKYDSIYKLFGIK